MASRQLVAGARSSDTHAPKAHASNTDPGRKAKHASVRRAARLDLGAPSHAHATYQLFPRQVIAHEQMGHHLTELWLTNHHISVLPPEIAVFTSLRVLGLGGNELSALPEELSRLKNLEALYLERNCFRAIPTTVAVFPFQLRDLRLDDNELAAFPLAVTKLRLLNQLGLSHNQIRSVPPEIRRLRNLVQLDLDYNELGLELPREMQLLVNLERLGLEGNRFAASEVQSGVLSRMPALLYLRISGNREAPAMKCSDSFDEPDNSSVKQVVDEDAGVVPVRHDGYFQCTQGYRRHKSDNSGSFASSNNNDSRLLDRLVPCRAQNLINAELYRDGLADRMHRKV